MKGLKEVGNVDHVSNRRKQDNMSQKGREEMAAPSTPLSQPIEGLATFMSLLLSQNRA